MSNLKPIYEKTTSDGTTIKVSEDLSKKSDNPVVQMVQEVVKGELPTNSEISNTLDTTKKVLEDEKSSGSLSYKGQKIVEDTVNVIEATKKLINEKNADQSLQKFAHESSESVKLTAEMLQKEAQGGKVSMQVEQMKKEAQEFLDTLKDLSYSLVKSGDFRSFAVEVFDLLEYFSREAKVMVQEGTTGTSGSVGTTPIEGAPLSKEEFPSLAEVQQTSGPTNVWQKSIDQQKISLEEQKMKQETLQKLNKFLQMISEKPEYQQSIDKLFRLIDLLKKRTSETSQQIPMETEHFQKAQKNLKRFLKRFTGEEELYRFRTNFWGVWYDIQYDNEIWQLVDQWKNFLAEMLKDPPALTNETNQNKAKDLLERGRQLIQQEKYRSRFHNLNQSIKVLLDNIQNDSVTKNFQEKISKLTEDLALNNQGKPDAFVMSQSVDQLRIILVPILKKYLENIPIDRVDICSENYDIKIENIQFNAKDILPDYVNFFMDSKFHMDLREKQPNVATSRFWVQVSNIRPQFKNVKFWYKKKSFPSIEDYGVMDMGLGGDGISIKLVWELISESGLPPVAVLRKSRSKIDRMDISISASQTKHGWLDKILVTLLTPRIKQAVSKALEEYLTSNISGVNDQINTFFKSQPLEMLKEKVTEKLESTLTEKISSK